MDLRVFALLFCAGVWLDGVQGAIPKCCVATSKHFPLSLLKNVERFEMQSSQGACDIEALVLYTNNKKYCSDPRVGKILRRLRRGHTDITHNKKKRHAISSVHT